MKILQWNSLSPASSSTRCATCEIPQRVRGKSSRRRIADGRVSENSIESFPKQIDKAAEPSEHPQPSVVTQRLVEIAKTAIPGVMGIDHACTVLTCFTGLHDIENDDEESIGLSIAFQERAIELIVVKTKL